MQDHEQIFCIPFLHDPRKLLRIHSIALGACTVAGMSGLLTAVNKYHVRPVTRAHLAVFYERLALLSEDNGILPWVISRLR